VLFFAVITAVGDVADGSASVIAGFQNRSGPIATETCIPAGLIVHVLRVNF